MPKNPEGHLGVLRKGRCSRKKAKSLQRGWAAVRDSWGVAVADDKKGGLLDSSVSQIRGWQKLVVKVPETDLRTAQRKLPNNCPQKEGAALLAWVLFPPGLIPAQVPGEWIQTGVWTRHLPWFP